MILGAISDANKVQPPAGLKNGVNRLALSFRRVPIDKSFMRPSMKSKLKNRLVGGHYSDLASYTDLFERTSDAILLVDFGNGEILQANPSAARLFREYPRLEGRILQSLWAPGDGADELPPLAQWGERPVDWEFPASGQHFEFSASRLKLADYGEVVQVIGKEVTAQRRQTLTDEMTGISNFRAFRSRLALEHERAVRKGGSYSVLFFDVDHFKHYNDRNGHPAGDEALRRVAAVLRESGGRTAFPARYGGEEFVILYPQAKADPRAVAEFAEQVRAEIAAADVAHASAQPLGHLSVSIGVASYKDGLSFEEVLKRADLAVYASKRGGRDRVTVFSPDLAKDGENSPAPAKKTA